MSRIIVKQLPKNITEEKVRSLFGTKGTLTDVQLKYTPDGKFRQFCFIGYQKEEDAQRAIDYFNNSCIQTSRIKVELCATLGSEDKPRSWSKYAKDSKKNAPKGERAEETQQSKEKKKTEEKKVSKLDKILGKHKDDPEFQEFMKAHDKNRILWGNDAGIDHTKKSLEEGSNEDVNKNEDGDKHEFDDSGNHDETSNNEKLAEKSISDLDYMKSLINNSKSSSKNKPDKESKGKIDLFTIKVHNIPNKTKRKEILKFFQPLKPYSVRLPTKVHGFCYVGFKTKKDMTKAMLKNKSFLRGKQLFFSDFTERNKIAKAKLEEPNSVAAKEEVKKPKWAKQEEQIRQEEDISESGRIFFRNLAYTVTEDDMQQVFEPFGPIAEIHLPVDSITRQIKGFGTVTFVMPEHAVSAFNKLDGTIFHGRLLHLIPGKSKDVDKDLDENDASLSFKEKKALQLKKTASNAATWNTLFLGPNAVAEILKTQFETSKEKILDTSQGGSSAAVRLALGETQIVIEMKKFLEEHGVCLQAFDAPTTGKRSKTVILAKNLPANTTVAELTPLFAKFGPIGRIVLPPSGVTALIEFCDPSEARQAFRKLAYSKFKHLPLYLEWAPENTFKTSLEGEPLVPKEVSAEEAKEETETEEKVPVVTEITEPESREQLEIKTSTHHEEDADEEPEPNTTLFLRNLNFTTAQDTIYNHFKHLGTIHTVEIAQKKDPENPGRTISMGYGFIQFKKRAVAEKALKQMQMTTIDGNLVELKRSDRILKASTTNSSQRKSRQVTKQTGSKIMVRNIPFQAKQGEVKDLFKTFGELRSVRLPLKMSPGENHHRGFGFVDFVSKSDAKKAFEALSQSTHLYGRRLVLEWASTTDEDVLELCKRTAQQFPAGNSTKRSKKALFDVDADATATGMADGEEEVV